MPKFKENDRIQGSSRLGTIHGIITINEVDYYAYLWDGDGGRAWLMKCSTGDNIWYSPKPDYVAGDIWHSTTSPTQWFQVHADGTLNRLSVASNAFWDVPSNYEDSYGPLVKWRSARG